MYDGSKSWWREDEAACPVNAYGRTKLEAERLIAQRWRRHAILRSSIIYGPQSPNPVSRGLFLQFIDAALSGRKPTTFFNDEFRCPIYVKDIVQVGPCPSGTQSAEPGGCKCFSQPCTICGSVWRGLLRVFLLVAYDNWLQ